jgi:hypothetical protein
MRIQMERGETCIHTVLDSLVIFSTEIRGICLENWRTNIEGNYMDRELENEHRGKFDGYFLHTIESELKRLTDIPDDDDRVDTKRQREALGGTSLAKMRGMLEEIQLV